MLACLRHILAGVPLLAVFLGLAAPAEASKRIALVIGNSSYAQIGALANPISDGRLMAETLQKIGFETTVKLDADQIGMKRAIAGFGRSLRTAGKDAVGLFYYAGHGIQYGGRNYLMPIEADPQDAADLDLVGVEANWVLRQMESAGNATNIVILDACRNNPLAQESRNVNRGLARIEAPTGSFIAYATAPGATAVDGDGENSPFTASLAKALQKPGQAIEQVFKQVRIDVIRATNGRQTPWDSSSLVDDFYFLEAEPDPEPTVVASRGAGQGPEPTPVELSLWKSVSASGDPSRLALFLQIYPNSRFAPEAQALMTRALTTDPSRLMKSSETPPQRAAVATEPRARPAPPPPPPPAPAPVVRPQPAPPPAPVAQPQPTPPPPPPPPAQKPKPKMSEQELIEKAMTEGTVSAFLDYLAAYPTGVFADLAKAELANLTKDKPAAAPAPAPVAKPAPKPEPEETQLAALVYDRPLRAKSARVDGKTIEELAASTPEFPPVEGLPPSYWQNQTCGACHNWSHENLCKQAKFYTTTSKPNMVERKKHPFGGEFKTALAAWGKNDCK